MRRVYTGSSSFSRNRNSILLCQFSYLSNIMILFFLSPISTNTTTTLLHDDVVFLGSLYIPAMDSMGIENGPAW